MATTRNQRAGLYPFSSLRMRMYLTSSPLAAAQRGRVGGQVSRQQCRVGEWGTQHCSAPPAAAMVRRQQQRTLGVTHTHGNTHSGPQAHTSPRNSSALGRPLAPSPEGLPGSTKWSMMGP